MWLDLAEEIADEFREHTTREHALFRALSRQYSRKLEQSREWYRELRRAQLRRRTPIRCLCGAEFVPLNSCRRFCSLACQARSNRKPRTNIDRKRDLKRHYDLRRFTLAARKPVQCRYAECGAWFVPLDGCRVYCTAACWRAMHAAARVAARRKTLACGRCRTPFKQTHGLQKYCSRRCSRLSAAAADRARAKKDPPKLERMRARWQRKRSGQKEKSKK